MLFIFRNHVIEKILDREIEAISFGNRHIGHGSEHARKYGPEKDI